MRLAAQRARDPAIDRDSQDQATGPTMPQACAEVPLQV
jgi:hypothetical protein